MVATNEGGTDDPCGQENYEDYELTTGEWADVLKKANAAPQADLHLYILRSLANRQFVTSAGINAFRCRVVATPEDRKIAGTAIGVISGWVREVTKHTKATFCQWNEIRGEWTIGHFQRKSLRQALDGTPCPNGGSQV